MGDRIGDERAKLALLILIVIDVANKGMAEGEGFEPPVRFPVQWFSSSTADSAPFRKSPTLVDSSTAYKHVDSHRHDPFWPVLNMELLQFYYSGERCSARLNQSKNRTQEPKFSLRNPKRPFFLFPQLYRSCTETLGTRGFRIATCPFQVPSNRTRTRPRSSLSLNRLSNDC